MKTRRICLAAALVALLCAPLYAATASDRDAFNVTLFVRQSYSSRIMPSDRLALQRQEIEQSKALEKAFDSDPYLVALKGWGSFNVYDAGSPSQLARFSSYKVTSLPTLVITTPRDSDKWDYCYVYRSTGFDGDAADLSSRVVEALRQFGIANSTDAAGQCPDGTCPTQQQGSVPNIINFDDLVKPQVLPQLIPPLPNLGVLPALPVEPLIAVVVDPNSLGEELQVKALELLATKLRDKFPEAKSAKVRVVRLGSEEAKAYSVDENQTPALVLSAGGVEIVRVTNLGMDVLKGVLHLQPEGEEPVKPTVELLPTPTVDGQDGTSTIGKKVASLIDSVTGTHWGTIALAVIAVVLLYWRTRRAAGTVVNGSFVALAKGAIASVRAGGSFVRGPAEAKSEEPKA